MGDCNFPTVKEVRDIYPLPVCGINLQSEGELEYVKVANEDIKKILERLKEKL